MSRPYPYLDVKSLDDVIVANCILYAAGYRVGGWYDVVALNNILREKEQNSAAIRGIYIQHGQIRYDRGQIPIDAGITRVNSIRHMIGYAKSTKASS